MSNYNRVNVNITENQQEKIKESVRAKCAKTSIKLRKNDLEGEHVLFLTDAQYKKFQKAKNQNRGITIVMGLKQMRHNRKEGGFLGAILPALAGVARMALPAIGKALGVGALSGLASGAVNKILGNGVYLKKPNSVCKLETDGKGLYLTPQPSDSFFDQHGYGLYVVDNTGVNQIGSGLLFGKNSPFSKIPLIGPLLGAIL